MQLEFLGAPMKAMDYIFVFVCSFLASVLLAVAMFNLAFGVVYDTEHFADTFFILGAAWRALQGFTPVLDFGHFYGGFISQTLSWTMSAFGDSASALYVYAIGISVFLIGCAVLIARQGLSLAGFSAVVLLILTLMLTRHPLELNSPIIEVVSAHSFLYNRFAQAAMLVVALFVALRSDNQSKEVTGGIVSGLLVGAVCLTKSTFVVVLPGLLLALMIERRWSATGGALAGLAAFVLAFDPMLARFFGSLSYALEHVGADNGVPALIRKAIQIPLYQPVALGLAVVALILCLRASMTGRRALSVILFAGAVVAMTATMGGNGSLGQLALPTLAGIAIGCAELARRNETLDTQAIQGLAVAIVLGFGVPHVLNSAAAATDGMLRQSQLLVEEGPYARYLSLPDGNIQDEHPTQYKMLSDGIDALSALDGEVSEWGIVANGGITFEHALRAKPVTGYPLWQRDSAPEFAEERGLSDEVDVIMIAKAKNVSDRVLRSKMTKDFVLCSATDIWEIYAHRRLKLDACE